MHLIPRNALAALAVVGVVLVLTSCTPQQQREVAARVNGETITVAELMEELRERRGPSTLVDIIDTVLIEQAAHEAGITASADEMDLRWQRAIAEAGSKTDMEAILDQRGITPEQYREALRLDLLLDKLAKQTVEIPEQEMQDFYAEHRDDYRLGERTKARMILVSSQDDARQIRGVLDEPGADFGGLAKALSIDPATNDRGGDMGWFERDDYARAITDVAFEMQDGELSDPIEVPDGWVLVEVEGHKEPGVRPLEDVSEEIRSRITRMKMPEARERWIKQARAEAAVQIHDEDIRASTLRMLENAPPPRSPSLLPVPPPQ